MRRWGREDGMWMLDDLGWWRDCCRGIVLIHQGYCTGELVSIIAGPPINATETRQPAPATARNTVACNHGQLQLHYATAIGVGVGITTIDLPPPTHLPGSPEEAAPPPTAGSGRLAIAIAVPLLVILLIDYGHRRPDLSDQRKESCPLFVS